MCGVKSRKEGIECLDKANTAIKRVKLQKLEGVRKFLDFDYSVLYYCLILEPSQIGETKFFCLIFFKIIFFRIDWMTDKKNIKIQLLLLLFLIINLYNKWLLR